MDLTPNLESVDTCVSYSDWNGNSMGVNRSGKIAVLAARRGFAVVDLDNPQKPKKTHCNNKWEPGALEFNPHADSENVFALVMNQKIEIWNVRELAVGTPCTTLSGHTRSISDMSWHNFDPSLLLTCSMDTYINHWDLRASKRPTGTFTTVAGSSQVKWNRVNQYLFASAHDGDVRVWDIRKGNIPYVYIAGHLSKIHGLDWSPHKEHHFVTASNDCTVKFWNVNTKQQRKLITSGSPVWKARYTPFGNGLVTVLVPQLLRNQNSLLLWNNNQLNAPIHSFEGHEDVILEFHWRHFLVDGQDEHQLLSWSKDQTLRFWNVERQLVQALTGGFEKPFKQGVRPVSSASSLSSITSGMLAQRSSVVSMPAYPAPRISSDVAMARRSSNPEAPVLPVEVVNSAKAEASRRPVLPPLILESSFFSIREPQSPFPVSPLGAFRPLADEYPLDTWTMETDLGNNQIMTLQQEFGLINYNNPVYNFEKVDAEQRICSVSAKVGVYLVKLDIAFPLLYPDNVAPTFHFSKDSTVDAVAKERLKTALEEVSMQHVKFQRPCLDPCLRQLVQQMEELRMNDSNHADDLIEVMTPPVVQRQSFGFHRRDTGSDSTYQDSTVPFPRTCGARFCVVGDRLVVFERPAKFSNITGNAERSLRSLSALSAFMASNIMDTSFDSATFLDSALPGTFMKPKSVGLVYISDTSKVLPVSKKLAQSYVLHGDEPSRLCLKNAATAHEFGREDLCRTWVLLAKVLSLKLAPTPAIENAISPPWARHPFGAKLVDKLFAYYKKLKDVQMLALMACMLAKQFLPEEMLSEICKDQNGSVDGFQMLKRIRYSNSEGQVSPEFPHRMYAKLSVSADDNWSPPTFVDPQRLVDPQAKMRLQHCDNSRLLSSSDVLVCDQFEKNYSEILYRWNLPMQRTEVLKFVAHAKGFPNSFDICLECSKCGLSQRQPCCLTCKRVIISCSVCRIGVKGLLSFCLVCSHGGHMMHLLEWFQKQDWCPTGCGCYCMQMGQFGSEPV